MNALTRPLAILVAAALGGVGLWLASHWDYRTTGGYWATLGVVALAGLLIGLAQLRSPFADAPGMVALAWVPITIAAGWVLVAAQPGTNTFRGNVRDWSADLGLLDAVDYLTQFGPVLAFAIGLVFGLTLLASRAMVARRVAEAEAARAVPVTRLTAPPPFTAATADDDAQQTAVVGNGNAERPREILLVP